MNADELLAEWKVEDRTWQGLFGRHGLARARAVRLRLDPRRKLVKARDEQYKINSDSGRGPGSELVIRLHPAVRLDLADWRLSKYEAKAISAEDPVLAAGQGYDVTLIKREIVETVVKAGWSYQPVMFMRWS